MTPNYEQSYHKGWPDEKNWQRFVDALRTRDPDELEDIIGHQDTKAVDADIFMCASKDLDLMQEYQVNDFNYGDRWHTAELQFLFNLSEMRDEPLEDCPNNSCAMPYRVVSWFLRDQLVPKYVPGVDYMTTDQGFNFVQAGKGAEREQQLVRNGAGSEPLMTKILTGRDAAAYVHKDHWLIPWMQVAQELIALGVRYRLEDGMVDGNVSRFASCGPVYIDGVLGEGIKRLSPLSFREKWTKLKPRPEEAAPVVMGRYLPQTYAEGSPYHPSANAMHYIAAAVLAELIVLIFDRYHVLPSGRTVEAEVYLLRDNIGFWREWAGVHYPTDNTSYLPRAKALARRIIGERYGCH